MYSNVSSRLSGKQLQSLMTFICFITFHFASTSSIFKCTYRPWSYTALSKPVTWTKIAKNEALCFSSRQYEDFFNRTIYQLAFMTCLWVPSWQSSTKACHTFTWHNWYTFISYICAKCRSLTLPFPPAIFLVSQFLPYGLQWSTFFLAFTLPVWPLPHPPLHPSPSHFLHWSKVSPPCFSSNLCFFFRALLGFLPSLHPFIFPHQLWAEKFWQSLYQRAWTPTAPSHPLLPSKPSILFQPA